MLTYWTYSLFLRVHELTVTTRALANLYLPPDLSMMCPAVVVCRCSPTQKAAIVYLIKKHSNKPVAAIGNYPAPASVQIVGQFCRKFGNLRPAHGFFVIESFSQALKQFHFSLASLVNLRVHTRFVRPRVPGYF